jgi:hypothetical protein
MRENGSIRPVSSVAFFTGSDCGTATILAESNASDPLDEDDTPVAGPDISIEAMFQEAARESPSREEAV